MSGDLLDHQVQSFVREVLDTPLKQELLAFFIDNQAMDTPEGLAIWLGRPTKEVQEAAEALLAAGLLRREGEGQKALYTFHPSPQLRPLVEAFHRIYRSLRTQLMKEVEEHRRQAEVASERLRALEWEQSRFRLVLSSMTEGVIVFLPDQTVSYLNDASAHLLGLSALEVVGKRLEELESPLAAYLRRGVREVVQPPHPALTREWSLEGGKVIHAHLMPVWDERRNFLGVVGILTEVTALRERERQRQNLLSVLAHDIKSPLTAIRGFAVSALRGMLGELTPAAQRAFTVIAEQTDRVLQMLQKMVRVMVEEHQVPQLRPIRFDFRESVEKVVRVFEGQCTERGLRLSLSIGGKPLWVYGDRELLERVIANLLSNAVKYNHPGGAIWVRVKGEEGQVILEVEDTGVGIPPSELPLIFQQFYRASTAVGEGAGLGLAFVRQVVEAHGGQVEVNSSVGRGSLFRIGLPTAPRPFSPALEGERKRDR